ncbi:MAG: ABC transporter substrate-binding protein [Actinomycetota bacterium]
MRRTVVATTLLLCLIGAACTSSDDSGGGGSSSGGGPAEVVLWHGYQGVEKRSLDKLVNEFNSSHEDIEVTAQFNGSNDHALQKVLTALAGGSYPDIAYLYGSWAANIAGAPRVVALNDMMQADSSFDWEDFYPGEREAATVDGEIVGIPALVDNLAIVYNKKLFDQAGVAPPSPEWTWDDFRAAAQELTDPSTQQFGWAYPADASEDTVWHWEAMLWEAGGDILNEDNTEAVFDSPEGVEALTALQAMAVDDESVFIDTTNTKIDQLFNSGKLAMVVTGPWALSSYPSVDYGVEIMPSFSDPENHQTIAGPDNWVLFDNGAARREAAFEFLSWLAAPEQVLQDSLATGHLPTRASVTELPGYKDFESKYEGIGTFVDNLGNVEKARPTVKTYPKISEALGQAIVAVLLGRAEPQEALDQAAQQVDAILAGEA